MGRTGGARHEYCGKSNHCYGGAVFGLLDFPHISVRDLKFRFLVYSWNRLFIADFGAFAYLAEIFLWF